LKNKWPTGLKVAVASIVAATLLACGGNGTPAPKKPAPAPDQDVVAACDAFFRSIGPQKDFNFNKSWKLPLGLRTQLQSYDAAEDRGEDTKLREERITDECIDRGVSP